MACAKCSLAVTLACSLLLTHLNGGVLGFFVPQARMVPAFSSTRIPYPPATAPAEKPASRCRTARGRLLVLSADGAPGASDGSSSSSSEDGHDGGESDLGGDGDIQGEGGGVEGGEEEPKSLAALVESTFVMAASSNNYAEGLKAFIKVVKDAYERGYTVPALTMEVSFVPTKTAGRDLFPDEVELRSIWIALVYLTLEQANWPQKAPRAHEISAAFMDRFAVFVSNVMAADAKGHTLQTLKV
ncbi:unnamed protein product, partial [Sphacelaria rigidula]